FLLVIHNFLLYHIINRFKHLAQSELPLGLSHALSTSLSHFSSAASINDFGPVNTFYYVPLVYEAPALRQSHEDFHLVLKSKMWTFLETLFRHHLALLLPFVLALFVPRCKLICVSSLVIMSNLTMCLCFVYAMWQWLILSGFRLSVQLLPIFVLGPVVQLLLMFRFAARMLASLIGYRVKR
ncbi:hypothetical protein KR222_008922, partial [Zaprionus bogoriensis]